MQNDLSEKFNSSCETLPSGTAENCLEFVKPANIPVLIDMATKDSNIGIETICQELMYCAKPNPPTQPSDQNNPGDTDHNGHETPAPSGNKIPPNDDSGSLTQGPVLLYIFIAYVITKLL